MNCKKAANKDCLDTSSNSSVVPEVSSKSLLSYNVMSRKSSVIMVERELLKSVACRSLKGKSLLVLLKFLSKRKLEKCKHPKRGDSWIITNNGELEYPYKESQAEGVSTRQFRNAIDDLIEKGFLDITIQGSGPGQTSKYMLTLGLRMMEGSKK